MAMRDRRVSVIDCLEPAWQAHQSLRRSRTFTLQENRPPQCSVLSGFELLERCSPGLVSSTVESNHTVSYPNFTTLLP